MGMNLGSSSVRSDINVTPLVDVVLVLLIIFMVVTPLLEKELAVRIPEIETQDTPPPPDNPNDPEQVLIQMKEGKVFFNNQEMPKEQVSEKIKTMFANRQDKDKIVFFDAADNINYGEAVGVLDIIRAAGTSIIGMMLPENDLPEQPSKAVPAQAVPSPH